jgi:predicted methyltransferase
MINHSLSRHLFLTVLSLIAIVSTSSAAVAKVDAKKQLEASINGSWRAEENRARDKYRHPLETLTFFGVTPTSTVIELIPSSKLWYAEILAPYLRDKGHYIGANVKSDREDMGQKERLASNPAQFDKAEIREFEFKAPDFGAENSADFFLTFRNVHNFAMNHVEDKLFAAAFKVLKHGGVLGVVDHRAPADKSLDDVLKTGYLPEKYVIELAQKAGFKLVATSDVNNNPKDTKDYPKGVWTLPPTFRDKDVDHDKYAAIGESDRFTLKFVKP